MVDSFLIPELIARVPRPCDVCGGPGHRVRGRDGVRRCPICVKSRQAEHDRAYKDRNRDRLRRSDRERLRKGAARWHQAESRRLRYKYGISLEQYSDKERSQGGCCALCGLPEEVKATRGWRTTAKKLAVDHDHATGVVRDLLCDRCNRAVGNIETLRATRAQLEIYLEKWGIWRA